VPVVVSGTQTPAMHVVLGLQAKGGPHVGGPNGLPEHSSTLFPAHTRLPSEQKLTTVPELDTVPEPNVPAVATTPDETPTPTPEATPLGMVVPLVTTEPLDVTTVPEPDPFPLPERPKASRLVRAPHRVSKSRSDDPIAARTFHIFRSLAGQACHRRQSGLALCPFTATRSSSKCLTS